MIVPPARPIAFEAKLTDGDDAVSISREGDDSYRVTINGESALWTAEQLGHARFDLRGGDDSFFAEADVDVGLWVYGGSGNDRIVSGAGADRLRGGDHDDRLDSGEGDDVLWGGGGDDLLLGGAGRDELGDVYGRNVLDGGAGGDLMRVGDDIGAPQDEVQNRLVGFNTLEDRAEDGGRQNWVRPTKVAAPYDCNFWSFDTYMYTSNDLWASDDADEGKDAARRGARRNASNTTTTSGLGGAIWFERAQGRFRYCASSLRRSVASPTGWTRAPVARRAERCPLFLLCHKRSRALTRTQRRVPSSITTLRLRIAAALLKTLPRCPCCLRVNARLLL